MPGQLQLWELPRIDLTAKIAAEKKSGVEVSYHFCGRPIFMTRRPKKPPYAR